MLNKKDEFMKTFEFTGDNTCPVGNITYNDELGCWYRCVLSDEGCESCVFADNGSSCSEKEYDRHPCYHSDRNDNKDVIFVRCNPEEERKKHPVPFLSIYGIL